VRDEAVMDTSETRLKRRLRDYFDARLNTRALLHRHPEFNVEREGYDPHELVGSYWMLLTSKTTRVPFMFKPFDGRYLYWEYRENLLHGTHRADAFCRMP